MNDDRQLLAQIPLFSSLTPDALQRLATMLRTVEAPAGTVMFREDDQGNDFYVVRQGEVEIVKALGTPDEHIVAVRKPGEFVGEMSLFNRDGLRTASVRTRTPARFWVMTRHDFNELLHRYPLLAYQMLEVQSQRLKNTNDNAMRNLIEKNQQLQAAYDELRAAQAQIIEKEKLEKELQVAASIQASILPTALPQLPGYDFGAFMGPARAVGGDWFDFISLDDTHLGIVVGDVSDKGVHAAIFMAQTCALLRATAGPTTTPCETLLRVNRHLRQMNAAGMFVTVLYGILDNATGDLIYARAGHELPLLRTAEGELLHQTMNRSLILGLFPEPIIDEQTLHIPPGGTLLLYTDGATDGLNPSHEIFGIERLEAELRAGRAQSGTAVCESIRRALLSFQATAPQRDDITLVAVHAQ